MTNQVISTGCLRMEISPPPAGDGGPDRSGRVVGPSGGMKPVHDGPSSVTYVMSRHSTGRASRRSVRWLCEKPFRLPASYFFFRFVAIGPPPKKSGPTRGSFEKLLVLLPGLPELV